MPREFGERKMSNAAIIIVDTTPYSNGKRRIQLIVSQRQNNKLTSIVSCAFRSRTHASILLRDVVSTPHIIYREVDRAAKHSVNYFLGVFCRLGIYDV